MLNNLSILLAKEDDYIFTAEDFDTFKEEYQKSIHPDIMNRRKVVGEKLLDISNELLPLLRSRGYILDTHPKSGHTLSWDRPLPYNHGIVNWRGVRFGRTAPELEILNYGLGNNGYDNRKKIGFQKYTCFQVNIEEYGVDAGLFHAVPYESIDRMNVRQYLQSSQEFKDKLVDALNKIRGYGFVWSISPLPGETEDHNFYFDFQDASEFPNYYLKYDQEGTYSSLLYRFPRWDRRILKDNFVNSCLDIFDLLYPIYEVIKWVPNQSQGGKI